MKRIVLAVSAGLVSAASFAQDQVATPWISPQADATEVQWKNENTANKTTGLTPAIRFAPYTNQATGPYSNYVADRIQASPSTPFDSGRLSGMNVYNWKGYAQHYPGVIDVTTPSDSAIQINGLIARFSGTKSASSTRSVVFNIWKRDALRTAIPGKAKWYAVGLPTGTPVATRTVPFANIVNSNRGGDTGMTIVTFTAPLTGVNYNYYAGCTFSYTWGSNAGDTLGLSVAPYVQGGTGGGSYTVDASTKDTLLTSYSVIQNASNVWKTTFDPDMSTNGALVLFPIMQINCPKCGLSVKSMKSNIELFGTFPNPATNSTNLKFNLVNSADDVNIAIVDAAGRTVKTFRQGRLASGMHRISLDLSALASGTYVCLMQTADGDGIASQMTIAK